MANERRYSEREVAEILRLASEGKPDTSDSGEGVTLSEILSVTGELGLNPQAVEAASRKVGAVVSEVQHDKTLRAFSRTYEGEVSDVAWEEIVAEIRARTGFQGEIVTRGTTREWTAAGEFERTYLTITTNNGVTKARLAINSLGHNILIGLLAFMVTVFSLMFIAIAIKKGALPTVAFGVPAMAVLLTMVFAARSVSRRRKYSGGLGSVLDDIAPVIEGQPSQAAGQAPVADAATLQLEA